MIQEHTKELIHWCFWVNSLEHLRPWSCNLPNNGHLTTRFWVQPFSMNFHCWERKCLSSFPLPKACIQRTREKEDFACSLWTDNVIFPIHEEIWLKTILTCMIFLFFKFWRCFSKSAWRHSAKSLPIIWRFCGDYEHKIVQQLETFNHALWSF